ncbi:MAG: hypothetical protein D6689_13495 [Deltaproteobacteria bacterium]|nr:MAG: hypothetical protein D6689_13495 [Deltaproteobacteria bacterium]
MRILRAQYRTGDDFLTHYISTFPHGGLFFPTRAKLDLGQIVLVDVRVPNLRDRMLVCARVTWRRPANRRTGVPAGVGLEFLASERRKRDFLLALAGAGAHAQGQRRHRRLPTALPIAWRVNAEPSRRSGVLADIAPGGAFIRLDEPPPAPGTEVVLQLKPPGSSAPIDLAGRVAWTRDAPGDTALGVTFYCRDAGGMRRLRELVRRMERAEGTHA